MQKILFILLIFFIFQSDALNVYQNRIVGGKNTIIEENPWQVSIHYYRVNHCGGAIINYDTVLSAGHCFNVSEYPDEPSAFQVRAGTSIRSYNGITIKARKIVRHPDFEHATYRYDIAIVKLVSKFTFSAEIQPIALPDRNEPIPVGELIRVTGWGKLSFDGTFPRELQEVDLFVFDQTLCKELYAEIVEIPDYMFCAGTSDGKKDACKGDSGGPAVFNRKLVGIISFGIQCALPEYPGVYTSVSALRQWIDNNINQ